MTRTFRPSWRPASRRGLAVVAGVAAVLGTGAVAQAHGPGDGFLSPPRAAPTANPAPVGSMAAGSMAAGSPATGSTAAGAAPVAGSAMTVTPGAQGPGPMSPSGGATTVADPMPRALPGAAVRIVGDRRDPAFNQVLDVDDRGTVVGYRGSGADAAHPNRGYTIRPPYRQRDVRAENAPGAVQTQVIGINDRGDTVGFWIDRAGVTRGFVRHGGRFRSVSRSATVTQLLGIDAAGLAAGFYQDAAGRAHGFLYDLRRDRSTPVDLPVHADAVTVTGVNDRGTVTGFYAVGTLTRGFVLNHGRLRTLQLGAGTDTQALGVDAAGDVVGSYVDRSGHTRGFLLRRGSAWRVDVPGHPGDTVVNGLNDRGQLVGFAVDPGGRTEGFVAKVRP